MTAAIRLVAIDVDGTLLDSTGAIRPRVAQSIEAVIAAGCQVVLATGRRLQSATPIAQKVGISTLILVDGAVIHDLEARSTLYERVLSPPLLRRAVELLRDINVPPVLLESPVAGARIFAGPPESDNLETARYLSRRDEVVRVPLERLIELERVVTALGMGGPVPTEELVSLARTIREFSTVFWNPSAAGYQTKVLELGPPGVSKGRALDWLAKYLGIPRESTMAIGDYENDLSLVEAAGVGIAMGNAITSVKAVARAVVSDNDHDGVAEALEEWVLGRANRSQETEDGSQDSVHPSREQRSDSRAHAESS